MVWYVAIFYRADIISCMDKSKIMVIAAHIAASYVRRELDRSFYDQIMQTSFGQSLIYLSDKQKYAFEFIAYSITALAIHQKPNPGAIRTFINCILADAPSEIVKRMMDDTFDLSPEDITGTLNDISDDELMMLVELQTKQSAQNNKASQHNEHDQSRSIIGKLTDKVNESRQQLRNKRRK